MGKGTNIVKTLVYNNRDKEELTYNELRSKILNNLKTAADILKRDALEN